MDHRFNRLARASVTLAAAAALTLTFFTPAHAAGTQLEPAGITRAEADAPEPLTSDADVAAAATPRYPATGGTRRFVDVPRSHKFSREITWMYAEGLTTGTKTKQGTKYYPKSKLTREAMAAFLYRQAGRPSFKAGTRFADMRKKGQKFTREIAWMRAAGLSKGTKTKQGYKYYPKSKLSREAMAAFLYRQAGSPGIDPAGKLFPDVTRKNSKFYTSIQWMRQVGLSTGVKQDNGAVHYDPHGTITREAMAAFLYRQAGSPEFIDSGKTTIAGTPMVGQTLTAKTTDWKPANVQYAYQWYRDRTPIDGATTESYTPADTDAGTHLQARVTATLEGAKTVTATTASVQVLTRQVLPGKVTITGTPMVGQTLTAKATSWAPSAVTFTYQWYRGGQPVGGATSSTYLAAAADQGKKLSVRVTGTLEGHTPATRDSAQTRAVAAKAVTISEIEDRVLFLINEERARRGLHKLWKSNLHQPKARAWSQHLVDTGSGLVHSSSGYYIAPGKPPAYGENLATTKYATSLSAADYIFDLWMKSPAHRDFMLGADLRSGAAGIARHTLDPDCDRELWGDASCDDEGGIAAFMGSPYYDENLLGDEQPSNYPGALCEPTQYGAAPKPDWWAPMCQAPNGRSVPRGDPPNGSWG